MLLCFRDLWKMHQDAGRLAHPQGVPQPEQNRRKLETGHHKPQCPSWDAHNGED